MKNVTPTDWLDMASRRPRRRSASASGGAGGEAVIATEDSWAWFSGWGIWGPSRAIGGLDLPERVADRRRTSIRLEASS